MGKEESSKPVTTVKKEVPSTPKSTVKKVAPSTPKPPTVKPNVTGTPKPPPKTAVSPKPPSKSSSTKPPTTPKTPATPKTPSSKTPKKKEEGTPKTPTTKPTTPKTTTPKTPTPKPTTPKSVKSTSTPRTPKTPTSDTQPQTPNGSAEGEQLTPLEFQKKVKTRFELVSEDSTYAPLTLNDPPIDYSEVEDEDVELWLFQVPKYFDPSILNEKTLTFQGKDGNISEFTHANTSYALQYSDSNEFSKFINIFPSEQHERYLLGKPFAGQVSIFENVPLPNKECKLEDKKEVPQIPNLRLHYSPIGFGTARGVVRPSSQLPKVKKEKKKKKKDQTDTKKKRKIKVKTEEKPKKRKLKDSEEEQKKKKRKVTKD